LPIEDRKRLLTNLLRRAHSSIVANEYFEGDGAKIFRHACALGCEGIVSKRLGSLYRSGRSNNWVKVKNPASPAVHREAEEEWR
jgi:bifunctional non-homologous end joining protein LigD